MNKSDMIRAIETYFGTHATNHTVTQDQESAHFFKFSLSGPPLQACPTATHLFGREEYVHDCGYDQCSLMKAYISLRDPDNEVKSVTCFVNTIPDMETKLSEWFPPKNSLSTNARALLDTVN